MDLNPMNYPHPLVALTGRKRSGKDTVAGVLVNEYGYRRFAFADPLKEAVYRTNPWITSTTGDEVSATISHVRLASFVDLLGWEKAKETPEVRRLLQDYGMSIREIYPEFWILATMVPVDDAREEQPVVIADARFRNELDTIRDVGGVIIRVERPSLADDDEHVSEHEFRDYPADVVLDNDGSIADLEAKVRDLVQQ